MRVYLGYDIDSDINFVTYEAELHHLDCLTGAFQELFTCIKNSQLSNFCVQKFPLEEASEGRSINKCCAGVDLYRLPCACQN